MKDGPPFRFGAAWRRSASQAGLELFDGVARGLANATAGHGVTTVVVGGIVAVAAVARVGLDDDLLVVSELESVQASAYAAGLVSGPVSELEHVPGLGSVSEDVAAAAVVVDVGAANVAAGAVSVAASATAAVAGTEVWEPGEGAESVVVEVPAGPVVRLVARLAALLPSGFRV